MQHFRKLKVWEKSHALVLGIYRATATFPESERYGLTSQMRRAAFSVPANIAEGCGRAGRSELKQFLHMSLGSASELDYFLLLARELQFLTSSQYDALDGRIREIKLMLSGLIQKVGGISSSPKTSTKTTARSSGTKAMGFPFELKTYN